MLLVKTFLSDGTNISMQCDKQHSSGVINYGVMCQTLVIDVKIFLHDGINIIIQCDKHFYNGVINFTVQCDKHQCPM